MVTLAPDPLENSKRMSVTEAPALTRLRHRQALEECLACLARAQGALLPELRVEDLRLKNQE